MSRTWKDGRAKRYWREFFKKCWQSGYLEDYVAFPVPRVQGGHPRWTATNYHKNPGFWNHIYTIIPNRRKTRTLERHCHKMTTSDTDVLLWPLNNRPKLHYW